MNEQVIQIEKLSGAGKFSGSFFCQFQDIPLIENGVSFKAVDFSKLIQ